MKVNYSYFFFLIFAFYSCNNENEKRQAEATKDNKKKEVLFSNINKSWVFNANPINETSRIAVLNWKEWRSFLAELDQKPKTSMGAFQKKAAQLSNKALALNDFIPTEFNKPQIKARIAILITKVQMLDLYIHLNDIPEQKVIDLIPEISIELVALQNQMEKIVQKSKIPLEEGESELLRMLDTTRAIPNTLPN